MLRALSRIWNTVELAEQGTSTEIFLRRPPKSITSCAVPEECPVAVEAVPAGLEESQPVIPAIITKAEMINIATGLTKCN